MPESMERRVPEPGKRVSDVGLLALLAGAQDVAPGDEGGAVELLWKKAHEWQVFFDHMPSRRHFDELMARAAAEFVRWWQDETLLRPSPGEQRRILVPMPQEVEMHHRVLTRVLEARTVMLQQRSEVTLPDAYGLPCKRCGRIFKTKAPRFARTCNGCQNTPAYEQRLRPHQHGGLPVFAGGFFVKGEQRAQYVWPAVCEHPDCVAVFSAKRSDESYCPTHTRVSALRARRRSTTPKHKRFRFYPNYSECDEGSAIRYELTIDGERRVCTIDGDGYEARDEAEFRPLASYAAGRPGMIRIVAVAFRNA